jgi:uroporphyrinogen-III synthase
MTDGEEAPSILVTRPKEDAEALIPELTARNLKPLLEPLLSIKLVDGPVPDLTGVQGLLFTSANGVRAYCARGGGQACPVFAVGDATAQEAKAHGFDVVESAAGNVKDLCALVQRRCAPERGALFHPAGSAVAGDLGGELSQAGFEYRREALYAAEKARKLSQKCLDEFHGEKIKYALFYSPRTARSFGALAWEAGIADGCRQVSVLCLSKAVALATENLSWRALVIASAPSQDALLAALDMELGRLVR